ncbi:hypothetical protein ACEPAF_7797 [Sanghuangporus sanghuang]
MRIEFVALNEALLQWEAWANGHFRTHIADGAVLDYGFLTPLSPLPQFLEDVREEPIEQPPNLNLFDVIQENPIVQDIA